MSILTAALLISILCCPCPGATTAAQNAKTSLDYVLVITGEELLRGAFPDAHTAFITRTLHLLGAHCVASITVDDKEADIRDAVQIGLRKAKLVIVTGGLGPTVNDVTRGALAEVTGIKLAENPEALAAIEKRVGQSREQLRPNLRRQALVPARGSFLKNTEGTAVGLVFETNDTVVIALPGPPRELQPMVNNELVPYLTRKFGLRTPGSSLTLRFVGMGQSQIDQTIREHVALPKDLVVGSTFEGSRVDFIFALPGNSDADREQLRQIEAGVRQHLSPQLYATGNTTLEAYVVKLLQARAKSLALVEISSGGRLAASLNGVPGVESFLRGAFVAPSEERMRKTLEISSGGFASKPEVEQIKGIARAAQQRARSEFVIAIGEQVRDEAGKIFVWVALGSAANSFETQRVPVQGTGELAHANLVTQILDAVRRQLK